MAAAVPFLGLYVYAYRRLARQGYRVSYQKVALLTSTGLCSIYTWGFNSFGVAYLVMHDGLVHRRLPVRWLLRFGYVREIYRAHLIHHTGREGRVPYGFFLAPWELARITRSRSTPSERAPRPSASP